jgi:hypothetical protein
MTSLCIALLLLCGALYAESLPEGWEVWPWELGATAEIRADGEIKYQGTSSLAIVNPTGTLAVVLPTVRLTPGQAYVFKAWLRTDLKAGQEAHLALALYDAEGNYLEEAQSQSLSGQTEWKQVKVQVRAAKAAKASLCCRVWGAGEGAVWFDQLGMEAVQPFERVQIPAGGFESQDFAVKAEPLRLNPRILGQRFYIWTELSRSPETGWQNKDRARIDLSANFSSGPSVWLQLHGMDSTTDFYNQRNLAPSFGIRAFTLSDKFKYQTSTLNWNFGRLWLDYSPFILTLTDDERGRYTVRPGASLENIPFAGGNLACFVFPEGQNFAWGSRYRLQREEAALAVTLFNRQQALTISERDAAANFNYKLKDGKVTLDLAQQAQGTGKAAKAALAAYESSLAPFSYKLRYFNFASDFDPPYRDKMPQYSSESRSVTKWNVVDRYRGKQGYGFTIDCKEKTFGGTVDLDSWREEAGQRYRLLGSASTNVRDYALSASALSKGHQTVDLYGTRKYLQDYLRLEAGARRSFKLPLPITGGIAYRLEKYQGATETVNTVYGEYKVPSGYLQGLKLGLGLEDNSLLAKPRAYVETGWTLPNRVSVYWRHYTSEVRNQAPHFDPEREKYLDYDNQLYIKFSASFSR